MNSTSSRPFEKALHEPHYLDYTSDNHPIATPLCSSQSSPFGPAWRLALRSQVDRHLLLQVWKDSMVPKYVSLTRRCLLNYRPLAYLRSQAPINTPDGTRLPVTTVPNTNSFIAGFSFTTPPTLGSTSPNPPLAHPSVLGLVLGVIILLCVITSVVIFYLLRVRGKRPPQPRSEPMAKPPLTPSKIHTYQVVEVPELVINDSTMIDIRSPWSPVNPRKMEAPIGNMTEVGRNNPPVLEREKLGYFRSIEGDEKS